MTIISVYVNRKKPEIKGWKKGKKALKKTMNKG